MNKLSKRSKIVILISLASLGVLVILAFFAHTTKYFSWDLAITTFLQSHRSPFFDSFFWTVSWPGYPPQGNYLTLAIIFSLILQRWFREALFEFVAAFLEVAVGYTFKYLVNRPRPGVDLIHVFHKGLEGGKYSFPAGHVESYVAIFGFLAIILFLKMRPTIWRKILIAFLVLLIVLIGPSRVYMGEHWMSDVIGAYLVGILVLGIVYLGYNYIFYGKKNN